jgi:hypothetical protein
MTQLAIRTHARYRTIDEASIIELLLPFGWAYEVRAGGGAAARRAAVTYRLSARSLGNCAALLGFHP